MPRRGIFLCSGKPCPFFLGPAPNVGRDSLSYCNAITKTWVGGLILRPFTPTPVIPTTINCREFRPAPQGGRSPTQSTKKKGKHCSRIKNLKTLVIPAQAGIGTIQCERQRTNYVPRDTGFKDPVPAYAGMTKGGRSST